MRTWCDHEVERAAKHTRHTKLLLLLLLLVPDRLLRERIRKSRSAQALDHLEEWDMWEGQDLVPLDRWARRFAGKLAGQLAGQQRLLGQCRAGNAAPTAAPATSSGRRRHLKAGVPLQMLSNAFTMLAHSPCSFSSLQTDAVVMQWGC
jgi:predicted nucleic acid-binding protein